MNVGTASTSWSTARWWRKPWGLMSRSSRPSWARPWSITSRTHDLGQVVGADAMMRLFPGLVRLPDAAFISWGRYPRKKRRRGEIPTVAPDLVVEVLSKGNTPKEMARKLREYFKAGVRLVWYVDPSKRTVTVYTAVDRFDRAPRGRYPGRRRRPAGLFAVDPRLVRRGRAHRAARRNRCGSAPPV